MRFALVRVGVDGSARRGEPSALARASAGRGKAPRWPSAVRCPPGLQIAVTVGVICGVPRSLPCVCTREHLGDQLVLLRAARQADALTC